MEKEIQLVKKREKGEAEWSEEEVQKKLSRLGDISKIAETVRPPFTSEAIECLARLVIKLEHSLPGYDTILSDDASGRLPSRFLREIINYVREKNKKPAAQIYFLASGNHYNPAKAEEIKIFLAGKKDKMKKALVVTEDISSGYSIAGLMKLAQEAGINFDVASLSIRQGSDDYIKKFGEIFKKVFYGKDFNQAGLNFYDRPTVIGVAKDSDNASPHPERLYLENRSELNQARKDVNTLFEEFKKLLE